MEEKISRINYLAVLGAALIAFLVSSVWYSPFLFGNAWMELRGINPALTEISVPVANMVGEFVRTSTVSVVMARLVQLGGVVDWKDAATLGLWIWLGFPAVLLTGSVMWDNVSLQLAAIHAGDWLVKILLIAVVVGVWRIKE